MILFQPFINSPVFMFDMSFATFEYSFSFLNFGLVFLFGSVLSLKFPHPSVELIYRFLYIQTNGFHIALAYSSWKGWTSLKYLLLSQQFLEQIMQPLFQYLLKIQQSGSLIATTML